MLKILLDDSGTPAPPHPAELHPELPITAHPLRPAKAWVGVGVPKSFELALWLASQGRKR
jgi:hypothetical protein